MDLVVMAAGMGSRFGGLKQIEPVDNDGNFIIDYSVYDALRVGFDRVIFIIKRENLQIFQKTIEKHIKNHIKVEYSFQDFEKLPEGVKIPEERKKPLGTGHAVWCARDKISSHFAVINADDFYGADSYKILAGFLKGIKTDKENVLISYSAAKTIANSGCVKRGICKIAGGKLESITESVIEKRKDGLFAKSICDENGHVSQIAENQPVSMNMFGFNISFKDYLDKSFKNFIDKNKDNLTEKEFFLPSAATELIESGEGDLYVLPTTATWYGITYRQDLDDVKMRIKEMKAKGIYPEHLWK